MCPAVNSFKCFEQRTVTMLMGVNILQAADVQLGKETYDMCHLTDFTKQSRRGATRCVYPVRPAGYQAVIRVRQPSRFAVQPICVTDYQALLCINTQAAHVSTNITKSKIQWRRTHTPSAYGCDMIHTVAAELLCGFCVRRNSIWCTTFNP
jgi:hypothetical protein